MSVEAVHAAPAAQAAAAASPAPAPSPNPEFDAAPHGGLAEFVADWPLPAEGDTLGLTRCARQLDLVAGQMRRVLPSMLATNLVVSLLLWRGGLPRVAVVWFAVSAAYEFWRWRMAHQVDLRPAPTLQSARVLRRFGVAFVCAGVARAALVPLLFAQPVGDAHYAFTMVHIGIAAGAVAATAAVTWAYLAWALLVGGSLALGWALQGGVMGASLGGLTLLLFTVLVLYVRDQARTVIQVLRLAHEKDALSTSLRVERDRAQAAGEAKTRFFAAASHDLRQPLHALSINATTLELMSRRQADPRLRELSQNINRALRQSENLLEGLLDISRLDADAVHPQLRAVEPLALLEGLRDEFAPVAAQRGLRLELDTLALPPGLHLWTDADLLLRVLNNLVGNALKFTRDGRVRIVARAVGGMGAAASVRISVTDTGPGIPAHEQQRVFEEFYQLGNPARDRTQGLGLGLSIVRRLADLLGLRVQLHSEVGRGTTLEVDVPGVNAVATAPAAEAETTAAASATATPQEGGLAGLRVLVVDDDEAILASLRALLAQLGCEARAVASGALAVDALDGGAWAPQVLLVDYRLREENGIEVIDTLHRLLGPVQTVVVTGDTAPPLMRRMTELGHRVLHKPINGFKLARVLQERRSEAPAAEPLHEA